MSSELEQSRKETKDAFRSRAVLYRLFFEELSREIGAEKSAEVMKRAIYRWGEGKSGKYKALAEKSDFRGVAEEFVNTSPCGGELFTPSVEMTDENTAVVDMHSCPLAEAWRDMDLPPEEVHNMCKIANATDYGKYEGMGFDLDIESTVAGGAKRCRLVISRKEEK